MHLWLSINIYHIEHGTELPQCKKNHKEEYKAYQLQAQCKPVSAVCLREVMQFHVTLHQCYPFNVLDNVVQWRLTKLIKGVLIES